MPEPHMAVTVPEKVFSLAWILIAEAGEDRYYFLVSSKRAW
jgi:hypothetical protein